MAILVLNRYPVSLIKIQEWVLEAHNDVYIFSPNKHAAGFSGYALTQGFQNYLDDQAIHHDACSLFDEHPFDTIIALDEVDIVRAGRLRDTLRIKGQGEASAQAFRDKFIMKSLLLERGLVPRFAKVKDQRELIEFIEDVGFPIVVKPIAGMGAVDTFKVETNEEAELINFGLDDLMAEEYVSGTMYSIDGIVHDGVITFASVCRYNQGCLAYQHGEGLFIEVLDPREAVVAPLMSFAEAVLGALPTPQTTSFHCEVFLRADGSILLCEIASRTPGARMAECIRQSYGIDLDEASVKLQVGLQYDFSQVKFKQPHAVFLVPTPTGVITGLPGKLPFDFVREYQPRVPIGSLTTQSTSSVDTLASVVLAGENTGDIARNYETVRSYLSATVTWTAP